MRRALAWVVVVLVVLGGGYLGDNFLRGYAQDRIVEAVQGHLADGKVSVRLGGTPFFLAWFTRSVPQAHVELASLPLEISGHAVHLTEVVADTGEVRLTAEGASIATLTGSGILGYPDLAKIADVPITHAGKGRLQLRYSRVLFGRQLDFAISALPKLDVAAQVVRLSDPKLDLAGNAIDLNLTQEQLDGIVEPIAVRLDYGLRLTSLIPDDAGVVVGVEGTNVTVPIP